MRKINQFLVVMMLSLLSACNMNSEPITITTTTVSDGPTQYRSINLGSVIINGVRHPLWNGERYDVLGRVNIDGTPLFVISPSQHDFKMDDLNTIKAPDTDYGLLITADGTADGRYLTNLSTAPRLARSKAKISPADLVLKPYADY